MNDQSRAKVAGLLAWGTFGAINGAVIGAMISNSLGIAGPPVAAMGIGVASGAAIGIVVWLIRSALQ